MKYCEFFGNNFDKVSIVTLHNVADPKDGFETELYTIEPICVYCGCQIIGYAINQNGAFYCWAHLAELGDQYAMVERQFPAN